MLYSHNNENDIPYFEHIKMFQELEENDTVYIIDLVSLDITEEIVSDVDKKTDTETVYGKSFGPKVISQDREFEYTSVGFRIPDVKGGTEHIGIHFGTETNYLNNSDKYIICTTEREAKNIVSIIKAKCNIQINQFKAIFHGAGFNYEPRHYKIR